MDLTNINNRTALNANTSQKYYIDLPILLKNQSILKDCITHDLTVKVTFRKDIL